MVETNQSWSTEWL